MLPVGYETVEKCVVFPQRTCGQGAFGLSHMLRPSKFVWRGGRKRPRPRGPALQLRSEGVAALVALVVEASLPIPLRSCVFWKCWEFWREDEEEALRPTRPSSTLYTLKMKHWSDLPQEPKSTGLVNESSVDLVAFVTQNGSQKDRNSGNHMTILRPIFP